MTSAPLPPLDKKTPPCTVKDCPRPDSEAFHRAVCGHQWRLTHVHHPKVGAGGNNPKAKIRCVACMDCHSKADNYGGMNIVESKDGQRLIAWEGWHSEPEKRRILWDVPMDGEIVRITDGELEGSGRGTDAHDGRHDTGEPEGKGTEAEAGVYDEGLSGASAEELPHDGGQAGGSTLAERSAVLGEITWSDWVSDWQVKVAPISRNRPWWVGDYWAWAEDRFQDRLYQVAEELCNLAELDPRTISNYANVCRSIPPERRRAELTFAHHNAVYTLPESEQEALLDLAIRDGLSSRELKALAKPESAERERSYTITKLRELVDEYVDTSERQGPDYDTLNDFCEWLEARE